MRLALLIFLLLPAIARADPVTSAIAIWYAASSAVTVALVAAQVVMTVGAAVYGSAQARKAERQARDAFNAGLQDRTATRIATAAPYRTIYGRARVGADIVAMFTSGAKDQYKHVVCVHAAHECDAIEEIYIAGVALGALDGAGNVTSGKYFNGGVARVRVQKHLGTINDPADATLRAEFPAMWLASSVLRGFTYTVIRFDLNQSEFQGGQVPVEVLIRGAKLYDPRTGTKYWSQNPALVIWHYLTSELCGINEVDLPIAQYIAAANTCDATDFFEDGKYTINGTITSDQDQAAVLEMMAEAMAGGIVAMTWDIYAGAYTAPVMALYQSDIVGTVAITPGLSDATIYNGVKGQFVSPENDYVISDYAPFKNQVYIANDGRELFTNIDFPLTNKGQRVWNLARIFTEDQRNGFTLTGEFSLKTWPLKVGQRVTFTSAFFGQTAKVYRITDKKFSPTSSVSLTLKEDDASIWDYADAITPDSTLNTNLPDPWAIAAVTGLTATSGDATLLWNNGNFIPRILAQWSEIITQSVFTNGQVEIQWSQAGSGAWYSLTVAGSETRAYLAPVTPGVLYEIRARALNPYMATRSQWTTITHQAVGRTIMPPTVSGFFIMQRADGIRELRFNTADQSADIAGYRIKYRPFGTGLAWPLMTRLFEGLIKSSPYETHSPINGIYDFAIAAVDGAGNESDQASLISNFVIGDVDFIDARTTTGVNSNIMSETIAALNAKIAANKATTAQETADLANAKIVNIASDNILSPVEKPSIVQNYSVIISEQAGIDAQAVVYAAGDGATATAKTNYDSAITALSNYLNDLTGWNTIPGNDVVIVGTTFRSMFANVYTKKQALLNAIVARSKAIADAAQSSSNTAQSSANTAQNTAVASASTATWGGIIGKDGTLNTGNINAVMPNQTIGTPQVIDLAVTTNKIENIAITTQKIRDSAVITDKVATNQITSPGSANGGAYSMSGQFVEVFAVSALLTTNGGPVFVTWATSTNVLYGVGTHLYRDGIDLVTFRTQSGCFLDSPGPGAHTYQINAFVTQATSASGINSTIMCMEAKR